MQSSACGATSRSFSAVSARIVFSTYFNRQKTTTTQTQRKISSLNTHVDVTLVEMLEKRLRCSAESKLLLNSERGPVMETSRTQR